jgi:serine/threonine protein kinase
MHSYDPSYAHKDVKPSNVLITRCKGQAFVATLMNFGSARPSRKEIRSHSRCVIVAGLSMLASEFFIVLKDACLHSQIVKRQQKHITPTCVRSEE